MTVTMTDGTSKVYVCTYEEDLESGELDTAFYADDGDIIDVRDIEWEVDQAYDNVWTPSNPGKLTVTYRGRHAILDITVKPNNITALSFEPISAKVLYEGVDDYECTTDEGYTWRAYEVPRPTEGDRLVATTTTGTKTYVYSGGIFINEDDDSDTIADEYIGLDMAQSPDHPAQVGVNKATLRYAGHEVEFDVTIKKANIKSLSFIPNTPLIYIEGEDGWEETDASDETYAYYNYQLQSGDRIVLTMGDGATRSYYHMDNGYNEISVFECFDTGTYISVNPLTSDQATNHWGVGDHSFTLSFGGVSCVVPAEVRASGSDRMIDLTKATVEPIPDQSYTGHEVYPSLYITYNGKELFQYEDYELEYEDNIEIGTAATVTITGLGDYEGTRTVTFKIVKDYTITNGVLTPNDTSQPKGFLLSFEAPERSQFEGLIYGTGAQYSTIVIANEKSEFTWGNDYYLREGSSAFFGLFAPGETYFSGARLEPANAGTVKWNSESTASWKTFEVSLTKPAKLVLETKPLPYVEVGKAKDTQVAVAAPEDLKSEFSGLTFVADKLTDEMTVDEGLSVINEHYEDRQVDESDVVLFDFHFEDAKGNEVDPPTGGNTFMRVTIPLPEGWTAEETSVYHVSLHDYYFERYDAYPSSDGKSLIAYLTHFSVYALVHEQQEPAAAMVPVYRLYNKKTSEHLWTTSANEYRQLPIITKGDWRQEDVAWLAPDGEGTPVYRLYNRKMGDHYYSMDSNEIRVLTTQHGWTVDNNGEPAFWSAAEGDEGAIPLYCVYNKRLKRGQHHFTADENERDVLTTKAGWRYEKVAFYGYVMK